MIEEHQVVSEERWIELNLFPAKEQKWFNLKENPYQEWVYNKTDGEIPYHYINIALSADR